MRNTDLPERWKLKLREYLIAKGSTRSDRLSASEFPSETIIRAVSRLVYRFGKHAVETPICVSSLNGSRKYYQAISSNDETQIGVSTACTPTPKLL